MEGHLPPPTFQKLAKIVKDNYAKDGGEKRFTKMHCVLITNP